MNHCVASRPPGTRRAGRPEGAGRRVAVDGRTHRRMTGLALVSLGLGSAQVGAPGIVARMVGADDTPTSRSVVRLACGVRELAAAVGVGATRRTRPWLWARVAGDALDLGLLATVLARRPAGRVRALGASAAVLGVTAADVTTALRAGRTDDDSTTVSVRAATTVNRSRKEVYASWWDL